MPCSSSRPPRPGRFPIRSVRAARPPAEDAGSRSRLDVRRLLMAAIRPRGRRLVSFTSPRLGGGADRGARAPARQMATPALDAEDIAGAALEFLAAGRAEWAQPWRSLSPLRSPTPGDRRPGRGTSSHRKPLPPASDRPGPAASRALAAPLSRRRESRRCPSTRRAPPGGPRPRRATWPSAHSPSSAFSIFWAPAPWLSGGRDLADGRGLVVRSFPRASTPGAPGRSTAQAGLAPPGTCTAGPGELRGQAPCAPGPAAGCLAGRRRPDDGARPCARPVLLERGADPAGASAGVAPGGLAAWRRLQRGPPSGGVSSAPRCLNRAPEQARLRQP